MRHTCSSSSEELSSSMLMSSAAGAFPFPLSSTCCSAAVLLGLISSDILCGSSGVVAYGAKVYVQVTMIELVARLKKVQ